MNYKIAFLVLSCDKYSDLWEYFAQLFNRYWQDCPFDKYFATNQITFDKYGFQSILIGEDKTWSMGLDTVLSLLQKKYDYVLITLEDLFIMKKVDTPFVINCINEFIENNGNYLKFYTKTKILKTNNNNISAYDYNVPYRHNCVYALWKIETLHQVLSPNENAWEFEKTGANRTASMDGFFYSNRNAFVISNTVVKGKWVLRELNKIKTEIPNIVINRSILSKREERKLYLYEKLFYIFLVYLPNPVKILLLKNWYRCFRHWDYK